MRLIVSVALMVWSVEKTRWPVSAALSAAATVSWSRISPTRMTSGSWRRTTRMAEENESVSKPTSRWSMAARSSLCSTSTGSSMVTMWHARRWLMWSIMAASVVVFPEPVGPVTSTRPRISWASWVTTGGSPSSWAVAGVARTRRMARAVDDRW